METNNTIILRMEFWALVLASLLIPMTIYIVLIQIRKISRLIIGIIGVVLLMLSGVDVVLLQMLNDIAKKTTTLLDDRFFSSECAFAFYILPLFSEIILIRSRELLHLLHHFFQT